MLFVRSFLFNLLFYVNLASWMIVGWFFLLTPRRWSVCALQAWAVSAGWLMRALCGIKVEVRGLDKVPEGPLLIAAKHQSMWETFGLLPLLDYPTFVLKRELLWIPVHGWFSMKFGMIGVDRSAGPAALRDLIAQAKKAIADGRQIVIFPEGTRRPPGAEADYKPGAAALYGALDVPCVPVALNSGLYWPRRTFLRYPGTIVVEFLDPIPPGLKRKAFAQELEGRIEPACAQLKEEACPVKTVAGPGRTMVFYTGECPCCRCEMTILTDNQTQGPIFYCYGCGIAYADELPDDLDRIDTVQDLAPTGVTYATIEDVTRFGLRNKISSLETSDKVEDIL